MFPLQLNDRYRLVIKPLSLKCYPQYSRSDDISLAYSSSIRFPRWNRNLFQPKQTTLYYFRSLFKDYRPPNIFKSKNFFRNRREGIFTTYRVGIFTTSSSIFVSQNYDKFLILSNFRETVFNKATKQIILL